jgi:tetratricopeptide (TPR) repeat protein
VSRAGVPINLPNLSFELLLFFVHHPQQICTIEQMSSAVWPNSIVSDDTVVQRVTLLRKALGDDAKAPRYIESVRGRGYRLLALPTQVQSGKSLQIRHKAVKMWLSISAVFIVVVAAFTLIKMTNAPDISISETAAVKDSTEVSKLIERGKYYYKVGQSHNLSLAKGLFEDALQLDNENIEALVGLSFSLSKSVCRYNQNLQKAIDAKDLAERAIAISPQNSRAYTALGFAWDCIGNLELALANYSRASDIDPSNLSSLSSAAHLYAIKGDLLNAYKLSEKVNSQQSDNYMARLQKTSVLALLNYSAQAEKDYKTLFSLYPDNVFVNEAYFLFLYDQGKLNEAKIVFSQIVERGIERIGIYTNYAEILWQLESKESALPYFKKAAALDEEGSYTDTIVKLLENKINAQQAQSRIETLQAMVEQGNTWPTNYIEAAVLSLWALNDQEQSVAFLNQAFELGYLNSEYLEMSPLFANLRVEQGKHTMRLMSLITKIKQKRKRLSQDFLAELDMLE